MSSQLSLFTASQGENEAEQTLRFKAIEARSQALERVEENADDRWLAEAEEKLEAYLTTHAEFHVDDFWQASGLSVPREARALGPVVLRAARNGWIVKTGISKPSVRSRMGEKPIWKSTIWRPAE